MVEVYPESGKQPSVVELEGCIRKGTIGVESVPVQCGTALENRDALPLLDAVVDYLFSSLDFVDTKGKVPKDSKRGLVRKSASDLERSVAERSGSKQQRTLR